MDILSYILGKKSGGGGGGVTIDDWFNGDVPVGEASFKAKHNLSSRAIAGRSYLTKITADLSDGYTLTGWTVQACPALTTAVFIFSTPYVNNFYFPGNTIADSPNIEVICIRGQTLGTSNQSLWNLKKMHTCDIEYAHTRIDQNTFTNDTVLKTLVLRQSSHIPPLLNVNAFNGTPFASGGSGGDIYIPKSLYDHLGDGTTLDYKAATNWATVDGYGTITWHSIEGGYYETHYADGTVIS